MDTKLAPAVGRLLVTYEGNLWAIVAIHPDGSLDMEDPMDTKYADITSDFSPDEGDWIAPDMLTVQTWARLMGVTLRWQRYLYRKS